MTGTVKQLVRALKGPDQMPAPQRERTQSLQQSFQRPSRAERRPFAQQFDTSELPGEAAVDRRDALVEVPDMLAAAALVEELRGVGAEDSGSSMGQIHPRTPARGTMPHPPGHDCGICRASHEIENTVQRRFRPGMPSWRPGPRSYLAAAFAAGALTVAALYHTVLASPYSCYSYNGGSGYTCAHR